MGRWPFLIIHFATHSPCARKASLIAQCSIDGQETLVIRPISNFTPNYNSLYVTIISRISWPTIYSPCGYFWTAIDKFAVMIMSPTTFVLNHCPVNRSTLLRLKQATDKNLFTMRGLVLKSHINHLSTRYSLLIFFKITYSLHYVHQMFKVMAVSLDF